MNLSQAITKGLQYAPRQERGTYFFIRGPGSLGACSIGTAYLALSGGIVPPEATLRVQRALFEGIPDLATMVCNPVTKICHDVLGVVQDLNDEHHWSRERIVGWLESIGL